MPQTSPWYKQFPWRTETMNSTQNSTCRKAGSAAWGYDSNKGLCFGKKKKYWFGLEVLILFPSTKSIDMDWQTPLQFEYTTFPHRLTVLAGEDDLRVPSAVYHISWYPGANSCLVKDNTSTGRVLCSARYSISQESNNMEQQRLVKNIYEASQSEPVEEEDSPLQLTAH